VLVPAPRDGAQQVALGKLAQTLAYGARTLLVRGDFDDCLRLVREGAERLGVYLVNSVNPYRIEGQKSVAFEILQQLGWEAPDWIVLPAGNLGNTSAVGAALRDARTLGLIDRVPRVASVQAAGGGTLRAGLRRRVRQSTPGARRDRRDGHPDRRPGLVGPRRARHARDRRRGSPP
jgi:threonine synthase